MYDGDDNLSFSPDQNGKIKIEGLLDGTYQLRPVLAQSDAEIIEFQITDGKHLSLKVKIFLLIQNIEHILTDTRIRSALFFRSLERINFWIH